MRNEAGRPTRSAAMVAWLVLSAVLWTMPSCGGVDTGSLIPVSIGITTNEVNGLILIAQDRGYFADYGLSVTHKLYSSGAAAINGLLAEEVDLAAGSEYAFVARVLDGKDIRAVAAVNQSSVEYLVGRADRGIQSLSDLKGKRIGVPTRSRPAFALDRFLYFRGIDPAEITLVDVPVDKSVDALVSGQVDAIAAWQPYIERATEKMHGEVVVWSVQEDQPSYTLVMSRAEWLASHGDVIRRFLTSLVEAERYVVDHPDEARLALGKRLNYSEAYLQAVWADHDYSVALDQALVVAMEDQARWMIGNKLSSERETPSLVDYIHVDGLEAIRPEAVNIIR